MPIETFDEYGKLGKTIEDAFDRLKDHDEESDNYAAVMDQIVKLTKVRQAIAEMTLKTYEATTKEQEMRNAYLVKEAELQLKRTEALKPDRVSADTWAMVGANIAGIVLIIGYERLNVITSKALGFILKSR